MPAIHSSYFLEGIEAVPVDVLVDGDRVKVVEPETGWYPRNAFALAEKSLTLPDCRLAVSEAHQ